MSAPSSLSTDAIIAALKGAGEATRYRILALLSDGELTVKDLTAILGQSQPRISRHLKLLAEANLIERYPEGAWVYYRIAESGAERRLVRDLVALADPSDPALVRDREWLAAVKREHAAQASRYFAANAADWDTTRSLHVPDAAVEAEMLKIIGGRPVDSLLDIGTGTGRLLELFAPLYRRGVGIDASTAMLAVARANLDKAGIAHAQIRHSDIMKLPMARDSFDVVTIHQVLHYLDDPAQALAEAARVLRPNGRLLVVDFAPHGLEFLREQHAHRRLGFSHETMRGWVEQAGLVLEQVIDLGAKSETEQLTVTLWLARDPRFVVAKASLGLETA
ncbi:metalloregulator ArsR/SmtB family transcription factor [Kaistia dalseonensis]|uniref:ArsR family transcriptional regulator n=1 Tax=Kaistia dalseonensis TaxID=410840 RepID=A0ABU0HBX3_9HYPH|nr:metalloregulator ArsR/SmtB family transcription factor [Kaistia dalseonensis]MCX5497170.1 metalloregulator ArsR/SmtB family transcription factor [Kaistia dalseonensis]MDQ0439801.1 ArsR family transcriptional regulator [Kaistia dalseonensis]